MSSTARTLSLAILGIAEGIISRAREAEKQSAPKLSPNHPAARPHYTRMRLWDHIAEVLELMRLSYQSDIVLPMYATDDYDERGQQRIRELERAAHPIINLFRRVQRTPRSPDSTRVGGLELSLGDIRQFLRVYEAPPVRDDIREVETQKQ